MENIVELTEKELQEKLSLIKEDRIKECSNKINELLKEFNCSISTNVEVILNGQPVQVVIKSN